MKICLYNNKIAPDLSNNSSGKLRGRGVKQTLILRSYTNQSQGSFISSLRSTPVSFISPPLPKKPKTPHANVENIYSSFSGAYTQKKTNATRLGRNGSSSCDRKLSDSFEFSQKPKDLLSRIRKMSVYVDKSRMKKYEIFCNN